MNLERDVAIPGALEGYVASRVATEAAERVFRAVLTPRSPRAWTVTGVYGTGKSAFAQFVTALAAPKSDRLRSEALRLLGAVDGGQGLAQRLKVKLPPSGMIRAVATAQREPLATTVLRALARGIAIEQTTRPRWRPAVAEDIRRALQGRVPSGDRVVALASRLAAASGGGVLLVIDELGKCLEHAARDLGGEDDVYLLQQLAEATVAASPPLAIVGLLHQGFGEYGAGLALERRAEWIKVQGRFEDIVFAEAPEQILRLIGSAIERRNLPALDALVHREANAWRAAFTLPDIEPYVREVLSRDVIARVLPLHPVTALVLPSLCTRYAQNDRSLFSFLASEEPNAFGRFLREHSATKATLPLQRLDDVYDYFAGIAGQALGFRPHFSRWAEIHAVVSDARMLDPDSTAAIKVIGTLNLAAASGPLRASRGMVLAALTERPTDADARARWGRVIDQLVDRGLLTYRRQIDEYRLWEGSDFDVETAVRARAAYNTAPLPEVLHAAVPLGPVIAQRHSYRTGTLRCFERRFVDDASQVVIPTCIDANSDGVLLYWIGTAAPPVPPSTTSDGRPVVVAEAAGTGALADAAVEFAALQEVARSEPHLQTDGVARREVRHRLRLARSVLDRVVRDTLLGVPLQCYVTGERALLTARQLQSRLSDACDAAYPQSVVLWNELINRRELTSQGAAARGELIKAMLRHGMSSRLGLAGNGPETSMYAAVLERPRIHRQTDGQWGFGPPMAGSGLEPAWKAMTTFCHGATTAPRSVDELFALLEAPPYGMKRGVLPVLLAAVLLADAETLSVYREGSFLPILGAEHFEVLVKHPAKFSVKHFALDGLRAQLFRDLEEIVRAPGAHAPTSRNATILGVVRPLIRFATNLPPATLGTRLLSHEASAVRDALVNAREPDTLLFSELPTACGLAPVGPDEGVSADRRAALRAALLSALRELQTFHEGRRTQCLRLLHTAFGLAGDPATLRTDLTCRVGGLLNRPLEERLRAFVSAAANANAPDPEWLEALIMVVADRPMRSWTDEDAAAFEGQVADLERRFRNLEAVHAASGAYGGAAQGTDDVRRLAITDVHGADTHRVVWIPSGKRKALNACAAKLAGQLAAMPRGEREAIVTLLAGIILKQADGDLPPRLLASATPSAQAQPC